MKTKSTQSKSFWVYEQVVDGYVFLSTVKARNSTEAQSKVKAQTQRLMTFDHAPSFKELIF